MALYKPRGDRKDDSEVALVLLFLSSELGRPAQQCITTVDMVIDAMAILALAVLSPVVLVMKSQVPVI